MDIYLNELEEMVSPGNLMNSYKLYFLKAIIVNTSSARYSFDLYELACWMCVYSFSDVCKLGKRIRALDKLYDVAVELIETEDLLEASRPQDIFDAAYNTNSRQMKAEITHLCDYVPYRLIAYKWNDMLKGKTDTQKNQLISEMSYNGESIYSVDRKRKELTVDERWISYFTRNRDNLVVWIDEKIRDFCQKEG